MDWYVILKSFHVASAVIWIGGAFSMVILGTRAARAHDDEAIVGIVRQVSWAGDYIFRPAALSTLAFGLALAWLGGLWSSLFVILGLIGIVSAILFSSLFVTPRVKKVGAKFNETGFTPDIVAASRRLVILARFDLTLLFCVIADMVLKPTPSNWVTLLLMALVIIAAAVLWLVPAYRKDLDTA
jgi:hypothetical protein